jgi:hypothetical protein
MVQVYTAFSLVSAMCVGASCEGASTSSRLATSSHPKSLAQREQAVFAESRAVHARLMAVLQSVNLRSATGAAYVPSLVSVADEADLVLPKIRTAGVTDSNAFVRGALVTTAAYVVGVGATARAMARDMSRPNWAIVAFCSDPTLRRSAADYDRVRAAVGRAVAGVGIPNPTAPGAHYAATSALGRLQSDMTCASAITSTGEAFSAATHTRSQTRIAYASWISAYLQLAARVATDRPGVNDPAVTRAWSAVQQFVRVGIAFFQRSRSYYIHHTSRNHAALVALAPLYRSRGNAVNAALEAASREIETARRTAPVTTNASS